ncbi:LOW QUALITY PROTEIN: hypothetical protein MXB_3665 [Myxobolus squamalis]|nr:LOW QUALITY PROTEIN: hypothetical protein MXB_3665 [Myxobolus squamalis]
MTLETDLEAALTTFENCKDQFVIETYKFIAREKEFSTVLVSFIEKQHQYHQSAYEVLEQALPELNTLLDSTIYQPVFGLAIEQHEKVFGTIESFVITDCCNYIEKYGLESEGIFRLGASANLLARLKSEFDASVANIEGEKPSVDTVASCLKLYLRELPEPLLTYKLQEKFPHSPYLKLYIRIDQKDRLHAITSLVHQLPNPNYVNLKFLVHFLTKIVAKNEINKMTSRNISIVIGPNLLWSQDSNFFRRSERNRVSSYN